MSLERTALLRAILILITMVLASIASVSSASEVDNYIHSTNYSEIDWSLGTIKVYGRAALPDVVKNPDDFRYDPQARDQARNKAQARLIAKARALDDSLKKAYKVIMDIRVTEGRKLSDLAAGNPEIEAKVNAFISASYRIADIQNKREPFSRHDTRPGREVLAMTLSYDIFGEKGLLSLNDSGDFSENFINFGYEPFPEVKSTNSRQWQGLVVSVPYLKPAPALSPKIFSESGILVYDSSYVPLESALKSGIAGYSRSPFNQPKDVNLDFFHCTAVATRIPRGVDIVISDSDAREILSGVKSVANLKNCRVVILVPDRDR